MKKKQKQKETKRKKNRLKQKTNTNSGFKPQQHPLGSSEKDLMKFQDFSAALLCGHLSNVQAYDYNTNHANISGST